MPFLDRSRCAPPGPLTSSPTGIHPFAPSSWTSRARSSTTWTRCVEALARVAASKSRTACAPVELGPESHTSSSLFFTMANGGPHRSSSSKPIDAMSSIASSTSSTSTRKKFTSSPSRFPCHDESTRGPDSRKPRVTSEQARQPLGVPEGTSRTDPCRTGQRETAGTPRHPSVRTADRTPLPAESFRPPCEVPSLSVNFPLRFHRSSTGAT